MRAHLVQLDSAWEDPPANYRRVESLLGSYSVRTGDLVVLPEMFDTGFSFNLATTADRDGATLAFLQNLARRLGVTVHGSRTVLGPDGRGRNRATIAGPDGGLLCEYDKIHPFSFGKESQYFTGGDAIATYEWVADDRTRVCPAICYDLRFPELFRLGMLAGAEVFAIGANWPAPRALHRRALAQARAIENQAFVLAVNRAGRDPHLEYAGASMAFGPKGDVLAEAGPDECVLTVDVDLAGLRAWRATFPAWRDVKLISPRT